MSEGIGLGRTDTMPVIEVAWSEQGAPRRQVAWRGTTPLGRVEDAEAIGLVVEQDGGCVRVSVEPQREVRIEAVGARLFMPVAEAKAVYLNGYESWTDSVERDPWESMRGLRGVPKRVVEKYVLDGSGDYRFTTYAHKRGEQHGFGYGYLRWDDESVTLVGSLDEDGGFTTVRTSATRREVRLEKEPPATPVDAGERRDLLSFCQVEAPSLDQALDAWLGRARFGGRLADEVLGAKASALLGFTSWYRHYEHIDEAGLLGDLDGTARALEDVADLTEGFERVFQVDDGYAKVGDWLDVDAEKFPHGLVPIAAAAHDRGLKAGLWLAPFLCERDSRLFLEHADWLARDATGEAIPCGCNWSGSFALDVELPEVRDYLRHVLETVCGAWGFDILKLDFLFAACMVPHAGKNRGELMASALDFVRSCVGSDVHLLLCGVPMMSAFGRAEWCRVGCDVSLDWDDMWYMRLLHRERVSTKRSLANTLGRAHLDRRAFRVDPDVFFLRDEGLKLSPEQKERLLEADVASGGVLLTSDDMGAWDEGQRLRYHDAILELARKERGRNSHNPQ